MRIFTARTLIKTVLGHLIGNSIKHRDRGHGNIAVSVCAGMGMAEFAVADDGCGIPVSGRSRLFKSFQSARVSERKSSGLGRAISERLVERHGGRMKVDSSDGQRGTKFQLSWPTTRRNHASD